MEIFFETSYGTIKQSTNFEENELQVVKTLINRSDEYGEVRNFDDIDYAILKDLDSTGVISLRSGVIIIEINIALPLVRD